MVESKASTDVSQNPLSFAVKASFEGDFAVATEKVSADVLSSCKLQRIADLLVLK